MSFYSTQKHVQDQQAITLSLMKSDKKIDEKIQVANIEPQASAEKIEVKTITRARFTKYKIYTESVVADVKIAETKKIEKDILSAEIKKSTEKMIQDTVSVFASSVTVPTKPIQTQQPVVTANVQRAPAIVAVGAATAPKRADLGATESASILSKMNATDSSTDESNSKTVIRAHTTNLRGNSFKGITNFDIKFIDDQNDFYVDHGSGEIQISTQIASEYEVRRMNVAAQNLMPTTHDLVLEVDQIQLNIPMINLETVQYLTSEYNYRDDMGLVLVELSEESESVELVGRYTEKLFLDQNLKIVNAGDSEYQYILFLNVKPGNNIIKYTRIDRSTSSKIIHVASRELYYEANFFKNIDKIEFELVEMNLLAQKLSKLNINREEIQLLTNNAHPQKVDFAKYRFGKNHRAYGSREYLVFKHLDDAIYVGISHKQKYIVIPSEDIVRKVLSEFSISDFKGQCIVQIDIPKKRKISAISYAGTVNEMGMNLEIKALDQDGLFYNEVGPETSRIFVKGENQGVINFMLTYTDGRKSYLNSYCSDQTYLVEQL